MANSYSIDTIMKIIYYSPVYGAWTVDTGYCQAMISFSKTYTYQANSSTKENYYLLFQFQLNDFLPEIN